MITSRNGLLILKREISLPAMSTNVQLSTMTMVGRAWIHSSKTGGRLRHGVFIAVQEILFGYHWRKMYAALMVLNGAYIRWKTWAFRRWKRKTSGSSTTLSWRKMARKRGWVNVIILHLVRWGGG